jgi:outer membrane immunogenic protein
MRAGRLVTSIAILAGGTALNPLAALAADLPSRPVAAPVIAAATSADWSGFYLGGHAGWAAALSRGTYNDFADSGPIDFAATGPLYGVQGGYNWQNGRLVYGVELDSSWDSLNADRTDRLGDRSKMETNWLASARFRSGAAIDNFYFFGSIGVGYAKSKYTVTGENVAPSSASKDLDGWGLTSGFGAEYSITPNWSVRAEYLFYAISQREDTSTLNSRSNSSDFAKFDGIHVARVAASYRFGGDTPRRVDTAPAWNWAGFYVGAHAGYGTSRIIGAYDEVGDHGSFDMDPTGAIAGLHAGYNFQNGAFVYGIEADGSWGGMTNDQTDKDGGTQKLKTDSLASVRGRIGVTAANQLYYLTAGWGFVNSKINVDVADGSASKSLSSNGVVIGSGFEWAFNENLSARIEGLTYLNDKKVSLSNLIPADSDAKDFMRQDMVTVVRAGVTYRFGTF